MKNLKGSLILLIAAIIWGLAFTAQSTAGDIIGAFTFNAARSFIGAGAIFVFILIRSVSSRKKIFETTLEFKKLMLAGLCCGVALFVATNFQQFGISLYPDGVAAAGRSGFLTAMYVVFVALCCVFYGKKPHVLVFVSTAVAIIGMYLLCMSGGFSGIYLGDILELACAVSFTIHILVIDRFSALDGVKISFIQFLVSAVLSTVCALIFESTTASALLSAYIPILYTGILSSGVAYTLQIVGQKYAEPAVASIVMSLESVFAGIGGWLILGEKLSPRELSGCILVFSAVIIAQLPQFIKKEKI